jgi:hypothetical protein
MMKEALVEELQDIKEDIEEVIEEGDELGDDDGYEVFSPGEGNATNTMSKANITVDGLSNVSLGGKDSIPNVNIDPMLTMDLTQYNPPGDADTKEAISEPSVMETEVDRHEINGTVTAKVPAAEFSDQDDDDDYIPPLKTASGESSITTDDDLDDDFVPPAKVSNKTVVQSESESDDDDDFVPPAKVSSVTVESTNKTVVQDEYPSVEYYNDEDDFVPPAKVSNMTIKSTNKTAVQDESDDPVIPSMENPESDTEDDDDYVPQKSTSGSKEPSERVSNSTGSKETISDQDDDDFSLASKNDTLYEKEMPPRPVNTSAVIDLENKNATYHESSVEASKESSTDSNTTSMIPSESADDNEMQKGKVTHKTNSTVPKPIHESEEFGTQTNNTSNVEDEESIVKSETATASSTASETTSGVSTTTAAASTTQVITTPLVESSLTIETPAPSPKPSFKPTLEAYESTDDEFDPVINEQNIIDNEAFSDGEVSTPTSGGARDIDDFLREEEEEVRKVGGWMGFAAVVLAVWTAYQMSENPDGICAR